jgi:hypothetical protein
MPDDANREGNIRVVRQKKATTSSGAVPIQATSEIKSEFRLNQNFPDT